MPLQDLNVSINKAFKYVIYVYSQGKTILADLEQLVQEKNFSIVPARNSNGATISRDFTANSSQWIPQYIARWYTFKRNSQDDLILGASILFFDKSLNKEFKPLLVIGLFEKKDKSTAPQRSDYNTWWLYNAWFADGPEAKNTGQLYSFDCQYGDESYYWYKSAKLYAWELTKINSTADVTRIQKKIQELM